MSGHSQRPVVSECVESIPNILRHHTSIMKYSSSCVISVSPTKDSNAKLNLVTVQHVKVGTTKLNV